MERQVLGRDRVVAQNDPVVCKEESASLIKKELLILHIAVEDVLAVLYVRPMLWRLRAPSIDHIWMARRLDWPSSLV